MNVQDQINIIIAADKTPRSESIAALIKDGFGNRPITKTVIIPSSKIVDSDTSADVVLVDLMSSQSSTVSTLTDIKSTLPESKLIAMHIYRSIELIKPIYNLGVDGYLYCDPTREELLKAIKTVLSGKEFYPSFLVAEKNA